MTTLSTATAPSELALGGEKQAPNWTGRAWNRLERHLRNQPKWRQMVYFVGACLLIGWTDYFTGKEVNLSLFYAVVVVVAAWVGGRRAGALMSLMAVVVYLVANGRSQPYQTLPGYVWANLTRLVFWWGAAEGASLLRKRQDTDAERIQMLEEMRMLEMEIVTVSEHEQQRIGQDLHDGLCQQLAAIGCAVRALFDDLNAAQRPEASDAAKIEEALQQTVLEARSMARGIFPVHVDSSGLAAALEEMAQTTQRLTGVAIEVAESDDVRVPDPEVAMHLYRIAQEALANSLRHSGARKVIVTLHSNETHIELRVEDNGKGMPKAFDTRADGMGLRTMRYRAHALGAELKIQPRLDGGTCVTCLLPTRTPPAAALHAKN